MSQRCDPSQDQYVTTSDTWTCIGTIYGSPSWFDNEKDFPAGRYRIRYNKGAFRLSTTHGWTVGTYWKVITRKGAVVQLFSAPAAAHLSDPPSVPNAVYVNSGYDTQEAAENASKLSRFIDFDHAGGPLGLLLLDNPYTDNVAGKPNPTWDLIRLERCQQVCTNGTLSEQIFFESGANRTPNSLDPNIRFLKGPYTDPFVTPLTNVQFEAAKSGPMATVLSIPSAAPYIYLSNSKARWIGVSSGANARGNSAIYAVSFELKNPAEYAELTINFAVDDILGGGPNKGVYINGKPLSVNTNFGNWYNQFQIIDNSLHRDLVIGRNTLYFVVHNAGALPSGIIFNFTLKTYVNCNPAITPLPPPPELSSASSSGSSEPTVSSEGSDTPQPECVKETARSGLLSARYKTLLDSLPEYVGGFGFVFKPGRYVTLDHGIDSIMTGDIKFESSSLSITCDQIQTDNGDQSRIIFSISDDILDTLCIEAKGEKGAKGDKGPKGKPGRHGTGDGPKGKTGNPGKNAVTPRKLTGVIVEDLDEIHDTAVVQLSLDPLTCRLEVVKARVDVPDDITAAQRVVATAIYRDVAFTGDLVPYTLDQYSDPIVSFGSWEIRAGLNDPTNTADVDIIRLPDGWSDESDAVPVFTTKLSTLITSIVQYYESRTKEYLIDWESQSRKYIEDKDKEARTIIAKLARELADSEWSAPIDFCLELSPIST